ncbi:hypothetical protein C7I87_06325 [Mesorhizobium sp. SARCC-RB16n]|nr:hypothetical protein C7I87_06325 [Mesorhizobium sp. SARCC-RB16n]
MRAFCQLDSVANASDPLIIDFKGHTYQGGWIRQQRIADAQQSGTRVLDGWRPAFVQRRLKYQIT